MEFIGFITGLLVLVVLSYIILANVTLALKLDANIDAFETGALLFLSVFVCAAWYLLLTNSPFEIVIAQ